MSLKSIEKYEDLTHILLYVNTTKDAELSKIYIYEILKLNILSINIEDIYNNALHSNSNCEITEETKLFRDAKCGIISCVYIFGEGVDLPKLNGVCIAGNMYSEIRIIQYLLRANRLDEENPDKIAYYIIQYFDSDNWEIEKKSFEKVRPIMTHLRNVDENIEQKIFVSCLIKRGREQEEERKQDEGRDQYKEEYEKRIKCDYEFIENKDELSKLKLRLRYSKSLSSKFTEEQDEFNYVKSINKCLNIQSEKEYIDMADKHINFIPEPKKYFEKKSVWTNWYDFMGVDITKFIQIKQDWVNFCREKKINNREEYIEVCELYDTLPKEPEEFYTGFGNIISELSVLRIIRR
jgi:predicted helicase